MKRIADFYHSFPVVSGMSIRGLLQCFLLKIRIKQIISASEAFIETEPQLPELTRLKTEELRFIYHFLGRIHIQIIFERPLLGTETQRCGFSGFQARQE